MGILPMMRVLAHVRRSRTKQSRSEHFIVMKLKIEEPLRGELGAAAPHVHEYVHHGQDAHAT